MSPLGLDVFSRSVFVAFTALYLFSFREATRAAVRWGAFAAPKRSILLLRKVAVCSLPLLVIVPIVFYIFAAAYVVELRIHPQSYLAAGWDLLRLGLSIVLLGLFPRATQHVWLEIARWRAGKGQVGEGWLHRVSTGEDGELPRRLYSWQVVAMLGVLPILMLGCWVIGQNGVLGPPEHAIEVALAGIYVAQLIVLAQMGRDRNFYYTESNPRWLMSVRMLGTVPWTIVIPAALGVVWYALVLRVAAGGSRWWIAVIAVSLPLPLYCHQSVFLVGKRRNWFPRREFPEVYEAPVWVWWLCLLLALGSIILLAWIVAARPDLLRSMAERAMTLEP